MESRDERGIDGGENKGQLHQAKRKENVLVFKRLTCTALLRICGNVHGFIPFGVCMAVTSPRQILPMVCPKSSSFPPPYSVFKF